VSPHSVLTPQTAIYWTGRMANSAGFGIQHGQTMKPIFLRWTQFGTAPTADSTPANDDRQGFSCYGTGGTAGSWSSSAADRIPGIDEASVTFITLKAAPPKGVPFVVWSDLANGNGGSSNGSAGGASYEGRHSASDGHRIEFRATTTDGNLGVLRLLELITIWQRERFFWFRRVTTREDRREECLGPLAHRLL